MSKAVMDPAEVRRFAEELKRFNLDLQNRITLLQARFAALGETWQDQEHARFAEEFRQTMKALQKFMEISSQHTPFLLRKAQRIEEYLSQHYRHAPNRQGHLHRSHRRLQGQPDRLSRKSRLRPGRRQRRCRPD